MCFKKAVAKSSRFSRIFAFGLMIFSGAGLINLCTVCAETTDDLQGPPVAQSHIIGIDPGHQGPNVDMSDLEPLGPGSTEMKAKASTGTQGTFSGLPEYQLNLDVSLKLQQILEDRGYQTVLTRTDNDTAISNKERAEYVAGQGADICVRVTYADNMVGINWSTIPVTIVEMGFMTNESDDLKMSDPDFQDTMASGIADGIDAYFAEK